MFQSSVAAFYPLPECLFYSFAGLVRRDRFHLFRLLLPIRSEVEKVVHWMPEILFAAEMLTCCWICWRTAKTSCIGLGSPAI